LDKLELNMATVPYTPWHKIASLRHDLKLGELLQASSEERSVVESISNHVGAGGEQTTPSFFTP
jgi:hypothetical protein